MLTLLFCIFMLVVFGKLIIFAIKAAWGISKVLLTLVFLPIILIVMVVIGLIKIAFPILLLVGIISIIKSIFGSKVV